MARLYRPVGLQELALIWDAECRAFPPRLPEQPIFYPVTNSKYATQIARDWNTKSSSFAGYVTSFNVDDDYLSRFERHVVGSSVHEEFWIPAELLPDFNHAIVGAIEVEDAFFGDSFIGFVPDQGGFKGKNASQQFEILAHAVDYSAMDFILEISVNPKAVYLNCLWWQARDFSMAGISAGVKRTVLVHVLAAWERNGINPNLPVPFLKAFSG